MHKNTYMFKRTLCHGMARLTLTLPDELDSRFRQEVARKIGMRKGNIAKAVEEAIRDWISKKS